MFLYFIKQFLEITDTENKIRYYNVQPMVPQPTEEEVETDK